MGEIMIRGNAVMKGYYKDKEETEKAFEKGQRRFNLMMVKFILLSYIARSLRPSSTVSLMGIIDVNPLTSKIS
jgi:acyl-CoA synthetase (AMP-forming)/AMP-acid ligase II